LFYRAILATAAFAHAGCSGSQSDSANDTASAVGDEPEAVETASDLQEEIGKEKEARAKAAAEFAERAAASLAASEAFLAENAEREDVVVTDSGLQYEILEEGTEGGFSPESTDLVAVHYTGTLIDGVEFDSSRSRGAAAQFRLNRVIAGWTEGVQLMSEGDRFRFFIPPELAYGEKGRPSGPIGPNAALIFDVELLKVHDAERNLEASNKFLEENAKKEGVTTTASGLQYEILEDGPAEGASPAAGDTVAVQFRGALINGTEIDSSEIAGGVVDLPVTTAFAGWGEAVQLMSEGDEFRFYFPPDLVHGESGSRSGHVGPNEVVIYDVELVEVKPAASEAAPE